MNYIIINPTAGKGRAKKISETMIKALQDRDIAYELAYTEGPGHATQLAAAATANGYKRIIAVGGDGTLREVAQALIHTDSAMGIVPAGTGNDLCKSLGIPKDIEKAVDIAISSDVYAIDVMESGNNICINIACVGLDANAVYYASLFKRVLSGLPAYLAGFIISFIRYKPMDMYISLDGGAEKQIRQTMLVIANGIYYGGGFKPVPMADLQSGNIDLMFTKELSRWNITKLLPRYIQGKHVGSNAVSFEQCKEISLRVDRDCFLNMDGELITFKEVTFKIMPAALKVVAPL